MKKHKFPKVAKARTPDRKPKGDDGKIKMDAWEAAVLEALDSIAASMAGSLEIQAESHAVFMADARLRQEQHAMLVESERLGKERLAEVREREAEIAEQVKSSVAREQASLSAVREMNSTVKKALAGPDISGG